MLPSDLTPLQQDPLLLQRLLWPQVRFYRKQREVIESVRDNDETYCVAGHQLGKDFVSGFIVLWYFLSHPVVRIVTTSVKDDHLRVLWGEIGRFIDTSSWPGNREVTGVLSHKKGGPLVVKHRELRKLIPTGAVNPKTKAPEMRQCAISYAIGMVSEKGEGMAGHHAPATLLVVDECSGVDEEVINRASSWAKKGCYIGNPYNGGMNHWFQVRVEAGDVPL